MAEDANNPAKETPSVDVAAIVKTVTEEVSKALNPQIAELSKNQKILADTLASQSPAKEDKGAKKDPQPEAITADGVAKLVADGVQKALADRDAAAQANAGKKADRQKIVDKLVAEKLGGKADLADFLPADGDEAALTAAADKLAAQFKAVKPDFGNVTKDGGKPASEGENKPKLINGLTEGESKFANSLKIPA